MSDYRIDISDLAKRDIRDTSSYIYIKSDLQAPATAEKITEAIICAIFTLEDMPMRIGLVSHRHGGRRNHYDQHRGFHTNDVRGFV